MENKKYICPICGFDGLDESPYDVNGKYGSYEICLCCGHEFGFGFYACAPAKRKAKEFGKYSLNSDFFEEARKIWIEAGCPWSFLEDKKPTDWDVREQLKNLDLSDEEVENLLKKY